MDNRNPETKATNLQYAREWAAQNSPFTMGAFAEYMELPTHSCRALLYNLVEAGELTYEGERRGRVYSAC